MQGPYLRIYGVQTTIPIQLFEVDGVDFRTDAVDGGSDCFITKDEGAEVNCVNDFVDEGNGYSLVLTATEMEAARISINVIDQTGTKVWLDTTIVVETTGHPSAQHPTRDIEDCDSYIDTGQDPYEQVYHKKGDTGTEYFRKKLYKVDGSAINQLSDLALIGKHVAV